MLDRLRTAAGEVFANKQFLLIIIVVAGLIATTVFVYKRYVAPKVAAAYAPNKEYIKEKDGEEEGDKTVEVYFFYVDWCPHCKNAKPEWAAFKEQIGTGSINGHKVSFIEVDCEKEKGMAAQWGVKGYPTIKAKLGDGNVVDYDAKPSTNVLSQFLDSITGGAK